MLRVADIQTKDYVRNSERLKGADYPCIVCGRGVKSPWKFSIHLHGGGSLIVTEEEAAKLNAEGQEGGDMYGYPVGPCCARKCRALKPYLQEE